MAANGPAVKISLCIKVSIETTDAFNVAGLGKVPKHIWLENNTKFSDCIRKRLLGNGYWDKATLSGEIAETAAPMPQVPKISIHFRT